MNFDQIRRLNSARMSNYNAANAPEVDMHIHTIHSDGKFSIKEVVMFAKQIGLKRIYITDHNTILKGFLTLKKLKERDKQNVIFNDLRVDVGSEIACKILDPNTNKYISIEILAYNVDANKLQDFLNGYDFSIDGRENSQDGQLKFFKAVCNKLGLKYTSELKVSKGQYATFVLAKDMLKYEENLEFFKNNAPEVIEHPKLFYKKLVCNPNSEFYLDTTANLPDYTEVVEKIVKIGGIAIVAHPFLYIYDEKKDVKQMLDKILSTTRISGIEACHSAHTIDQREFLKDYALKHHILYTGGSDFHSGPATLVGMGTETYPLSLKLKEIGF